MDKFTDSPRISCGEYSIDVKEKGRIATEPVVIEGA
jgi:hypothetical protein